MASPASIAKHPLHPMLVPIPLGLWMFSLVCDLIYMYGWGDEIWNEVAFYTMAGGIVGALLAALPGIIDYRSLTTSRVKNIATVHMIMNLVVGVLFALNLGLRTQYPSEASLPVMLSAIGVLLLSMAGWLGGELVYLYGVAVEAHLEAPRQEGERARVV